VGVTSLCLVTAYADHEHSFMTQNPQYTASKYGIVGFVRAAAPVMIQEGITVNAICPGFIPTNLCPPGLLELWPKEHITPLSTAIKAIDAFLEDDTMTGETVELSQENIYFRKHVDWANESQRWVGEESQSLWDAVYAKVPVKAGY
jgi:15-hydroxyprostaglandin dehydrogenase (NAD)